MKQLLLILLISGLVGALAYHAGRQSVLACEEAEYKLYDTVMDENGHEVQLYAKERPTGQRFLVCNRYYD